MLRERMFRSMEIVTGILIAGVTFDLMTKPPKPPSNGYIRPPPYSDLHYTRPL